MNKFNDFGFDLQQLVPAPDNLFLVYHDYDEEGQISAEIERIVFYGLIKGGIAAVPLIVDGNGNLARIPQDDIVRVYFEGS